MTATEMPTKSIRALLKYLEDSERRHWENENQPVDHIYSHVVRVRERLEPAPPAEEVASRPNGGNWASKGNWAAPDVEDDCDDGDPFGIVGDNDIEAHAANIWASDKIGWEILTIFLNASSMPETLRAFVADALKTNDSEVQQLACITLRHHMNATAPDLEDGIPI